MRSGSERSVLGVEIAVSDAVRFRRRILAWWHAHRRHFPWRETTDPYRVLLAEVLLQKTDAPKVVPVYLDAVSKFPTLLVLAHADPRRLRRTLAPLGLHYRAERLRRMARGFVARFGAVPADFMALRSVPGVGRYIASAVCSQAFGQRRAVLDTNVVRVLERCFGIRSDRARARDDPRVWDVAQRLLPRRASDAARWNWALLDFAAVCCRARSPDHEACPVHAQCFVRNTAAQ
jgi:A/G-specific adenine glycosylase